MKYLDEFRDAHAIEAIAAEIASLVEPGSHVKLMEVCGGHTHAIYRHGLDQLLPAEVELVHGPGCPVCVIPMGRVDDAISIAERPGVIFTSFGDMLRVPGGRRRSLLEAKARGADVRIVYSPLDALDIARANRGREVVFFGVGFETTAPATALTLLRARTLGVTNFSVFCNHVLIAPALRAILDAPETQIDGFVGPGHVSTVIGTAPYDFICDEYRRPVVVSGFEPTDILQSVALLLGSCARAAPRSRTSTGASSATTGTPRRSRRSSTYSRYATTSSGAASARSSTAAIASSTSSASGTPSAGSRYRACASRIRRRAGAATSCAGWRSRASAASSAPRARRRSRSGRAWSRARAHAPRTTRTAATGSRYEATTSSRSRTAPAGRRRGALVEELFLDEFRNPLLEPLSDAALVSANGTRLAFTTDSYVVKPLVFPGGDIGELAVNGTVNDLAVSGATPIALSAGFVIEEGFPIDELAALARSMALAAATQPGSRSRPATRRSSSAEHADGLYITTAGVGAARPARRALARIACGPATACSSPARSATTAWPS